LKLRLALEEWQPAQMLAGEFEKVEHEARKGPSTLLDLRLQCREVGLAVPVEGDDLAIDQRAPDDECGRRRRDRRKLFRPVETTASVDARMVARNGDHRAIPV